MDLGAASGTRYLLSDVIRSLPDYPASSIVEGIKQGLLLGWWAVASLGRIEITQAGAADQTAVRT